MPKFAQKMLLIKLLCKQNKNLNKMSVNIHVLVLIYISCAKIQKNKKYIRRC